MSFKDALARTKALLTPRSSSSISITTLDEPTKGAHGFRRAPTETSLFSPVVADADADPDTCDLDCQNCEIRYPRGFKIDEQESLYGRVNGWGAHVVVATGRSDWVRDVADERGSLMEAVRDVMDARGKGEGKGEAGLMVSASNMPVPEDEGEREGGGGNPTRVLLLPSWVMVERVTPGRVAGLIERYIDNGVTNTSPLVNEARRVDGEEAGQPAAKDITEGKGMEDMQISSSSSSSLETEGPNNSGDHGPAPRKQSPPSTPLLPPTITAPSPPFETRPCPHSYLILLCSHRTRDARCGQSAPLLRKEFERQLRPLGLYRDLHDERAGGVGIYFINHVGGHKFSANVMVYRRAVREDGTMGEASQCVWLARVRPEDCEAIVKFTVLEGKVVKPRRQLRGGFDRERGLVSW